MPETTEPQLTESDVNDFESSLLLAVDGKAMVRVNFAAALIRDWRAMKARVSELEKDRDAQQKLLGKNLHAQIEGVFGDQQHAVDRLRGKIINTCKERAAEWGYLGMSNTYYAGKEEAATELQKVIEEL